MESAVRSAKLSSAAYGQQLNWAVDIVNNFKYTTSQREQPQGERILLQDHREGTRQGKGPRCQKRDNVLQMPWRGTSSSGMQV